MEHKTYSTLPPEAILIRREVFMEEQGFQNEFDDIDSMATHLVLFDGDTPAAVCRFFPGEEPADGRRGVSVKEDQMSSHGVDVVKFVLEALLLHKNLTADEDGLRGEGAVCLMFHGIILYKSKIASRTGHFFGQVGAVVRVAGVQGIDDHAVASRLAGGVDVVALPHVHGHMAGEEEQVGRFGILTVDGVDGKALQDRKSVV